MPIKKDKKKSSKKIVVKKTSTKGKTSQSQSITVNIHKGKSSPKQPSGKPTIASSIASLTSAINSRGFYRPNETPFTPQSSVATRVTEPVAATARVEPTISETVNIPVVETNRIPARRAAGAAAIRRAPSTKIRVEPNDSETFRPPSGQESEDTSINRKEAISRAFKQSTPIEKAPKPSVVLRVPAATKPSTQKDQSIKNFFQPLQEEETFGVGPVDINKSEGSINSEFEYNSQFQGPRFEPGSENFPHPAEVKKPKIPKRDKLDVRYENAFGSPYTGGNIKQKDYEAMIREQERINRMQRQSEKSAKASKKKSNK